MADPVICPRGHQWQPESGREAVVMRPSCGDITRATLIFGACNACVRVRVCHMRNSAELRTDRTVDAATVFSVCDWIGRVIDRAAEGVIGVSSLEFKDAVCAHSVKSELIIVSAN